MNPAHPNRMQTAVETAYTFIRDQIAGPSLDTRMAKKWFAFIGTLFLFIWFSNLLGYIPLPTNSEETVNIFGVEVPSFAIYAATQVVDYVAAWTSGAGAPHNWWPRNVPVCRALNHV